MTAYLSVLMEEFAANYLNISNLQNYQDTMMNRMITLFTEFAEVKKTNKKKAKKKSNADLEKKMASLENADKLFSTSDVPGNIEVVWQALEKLDYLSDFIDEFRNEEGKKSMYYKYFLQNYFHCNKIIRTKESDVNQKLTQKKEFIENIEELKRIDEKKDSDHPLTKNDSLTRKIMADELCFDFEKSKHKSS